MASTDIVKSSGYDFRDAELRKVWRTKSDSFRGRAYLFSSWEELMKYKNNDSRRVKH